MESKLKGKYQTSNKAEQGTEIKRHVKFIILLAEEITRL
jgi:hypothetical protein